ncbi:hypothetical protein CMV_015159 [Castanea mollissima]|uniref:Uncharacterized protein n=1 Tax=Castanea mollissima TaxID=60419 RepID=A0A8J4R263_9ROSI|nr:hypothetical protein CMV_015159 [Castanea mollissima]
MATRMVLGNTKVPLHILRNRIVQKCNGINNTSKVAAYNIVFNKREGGFFGFDLNLKGEEGVVAIDKGERASGGFVSVEKADKEAGLVNGYFAKDQTQVVEAASQRRVDDDEAEESDDELDGLDEDEWGDEDEDVDDDDFVEEEDEDDDDLQVRKRK